VRSEVVTQVSNCSFDSIVVVDVRHGSKKILHCLSAKVYFSEIQFCPPNVT
jgi:hypothetical protein